ncbi:MAG: adenylate/guanylate cyclase domain-containing protein [Actinobacteria bacterium]|nr:adenylate/guanylate cyclase domain-containing protein [Actinomycetota bacterium]
MDIKREIRRLVPNGALGLLGLEWPGAEPLGDMDLTVLFTDIDDYTALTDRLGDRAARELVRVHDRLVRSALEVARGREIKHTGDGIMACFASASRAIHAAASIQEAVRVWNLAEGTPAQLRVAIGMNSGAPIVDDGDLFGTVVNVASRVTDCADGGQVLATDVVRQLAAGKGFLFRLFDTRLLDGMAEAVPLYEVVWQEEAAGAGAIVAA